MVTSLEVRNSGAASRLGWAPPALAAGAAGLLLAVAGRYGYHRDELYFRVAGRHLDWGFDDQPPLVPLLARVQIELFGDTAWALRIVPALAVAVSVLLTARISAALGGSGRAQAIAAACVASSPFVLGAGHLLATATLDLLFWTLTGFLAVRWIGTRDDRLLLWSGLVVGVGLQAKHLIAAYAGALVLGALVCGHRSVFRSRATWTAAAIALLLWSPNLWWQARHGWPQLEMAQVISDSGDEGGRAGFLPLQLMQTGVIAVPVWLAGLWSLAKARPYRLFACAYGLLTLVFLLTGGRAYYLVGAYPVLLAAGAPVVDRWLERGRHRQVFLGLGFAASVTASVCLMLPVYPESAFASSPQQAINKISAETIGWPELVRTVASAYRSLPEAERATTTIFAGNYGQAGAIDRYGPALGLPRPYSGHVSYWYWGPPPREGSAVLISFSPQLCTRYFGRAELFARVTNRAGADNEERGSGIWICRDQKEAWDTIWPKIRHFD